MCVFDIRVELCFMNANFLGLRELCSKSSSLFYSEFPQKSYHYAHYYAENQLIILIILNFTGEFLQLFFTFAIKSFRNIFIAYVFY